MEKEHNSGILDRRELLSGDATEGMGEHRPPRRPTNPDPSPQTPPDINDETSITMVRHALKALEQTLKGLRERLINMERVMSNHHSES